MNLKQYKLAWGDFKKWYKTIYGFCISLDEFKGYNFEMQLGVYLKYLIENNIYNNNMIDFKYAGIVIEKGFKERNEQLSEQNR